ncbi:MAG: adenylate/guanylate cyclase domain-containing protein, partial [Acidobacteriaceae bacterium]
MAMQSKQDVPLEIAHILFIDTVGYSKLSTAQQHELFDILNRAVRGTERFRAAEAAGKLIRLPTGDGMALVFYDAPESPIACAVEISRAIRDLPQLRLRMGIHSGPVSRVVDVNDRCNLAGVGINMAERIMNCADAGHILLSQRAAADLAEDERWRSHLYQLGECEGKHGARLHLVNFYTEEVGNLGVPNRFVQSQNRFSARLLLHWRALLSTATLLLAVALLGYHYLTRSPPPVASPPPPAKSIAVLPFENL